ncbi:bacterial regulatory, arsR family protein [Lysobacter antibioticus]|uniref:ArsR/SmtB family transcription factor n=1 Tax=Lysobacter antibioticus TaxID=84531 RepID=UPI0007175407|nr:helix-turn-helix domain-containing protein [Lysobacter antibioticus]ALN63299.1 bacterial regulatory, arsR family protein [Lysobacter antibioticus]
MDISANLNRVAALIGDRARVDILTALMAGRALTATELAEAAGVARPTASAHLSALTEARLLSVEKQGRHRYFRIADDDVVRLLEDLMRVAYRISDAPVSVGPSDLALRKARVCYDHLAGEWGVRVHDSFVRRGFLHLGDDDLQLTERGRGFVADAGIALDALPRTRRPLCRACLDWSERRHHLAGVLGAALLDRFIAQGWLRRIQYSRALKVTARGQRGLAAFVEDAAP